MKAVLKKWGNSVALRLPAPVLKEAGLRENQIVEIVAANERIIISRPARQLRYTLSELLARMTDKNKHAMEEFRPIGNEIQ